MIHTLIVPGVGGSDEDHWQSWLQRQLMSCSRVQQPDWNAPILQEWVKSFRHSLNNIDQPLQVVAHSFGCLTTVAALDQYPELANNIKKLILVAPANPSRFGEAGFFQDNHLDNRVSLGQSYAHYFQQLRIKIPAEMIISENDPWLSFENAQQLAQLWKIKAHNLGRVGHINVASGFGAFPEIFDYLIPERSHTLINKIDDNKLFFKFAI